MPIIFGFSVLLPSFESRNPIKPEKCKKDWQISFVLIQFEISVLFSLQLAFARKVIIQVRHCSESWLKRAIT